MPSFDTISFLESNDPIFVRKRRMQIISFTLNLFFIGIQYSIIIPSAWQYLKSLGATPFFYAMVISASPLGSLITLPIVGRLYDKTRMAKRLIALLHILGIIGSTIYALGFSPWLPLLGRFISGSTGSINPVIQGEITWITKPDQRLGAFSTTAIGFLVGLFLGPVFSLILQTIDADIGFWHIDYRNSPGIIMALLWLLMRGVTSFITFDLANDYDDEKLRLEKETNRLIGVESASYGSCGELSDIPLTKIIKQDKLFDKQAFDKFKLSGRQSSNIEDTTQNLRRDTSATLLKSLREGFSAEIITVVLLSFLGWVFLIEHETLIPLVTQEDFSWDVKWTYVVYSTAAVILIIAYVFMIIFGKRIGEVAILFLLMALTCLTAIFLLCFSLMDKTLLSRKIVFFLGIAVLAMAEPLNNAGAKSLISKTTAPEMQGMMSSFLLISLKFGQIAGPLYGTLLFQNMLVCNIFNIEMSVFGCLFLALVLNKLKRRYEKYGRNTNS